MTSRHGGGASGDGLAASTGGAVGTWGWPEKVTTTMAVGGDVTGSTGLRRAVQGTAKHARARALEVANHVQRVDWARQGAGGARPCKMRSASS